VQRLRWRSDRMPTTSSPVATLASSPTGLLLLLLLTAVVLPPPTQVSPEAFGSG
jgi:hypothetical protein